MKCLWSIFIWEDSYTERNIKSQDNYLGITKHKYSSYHYLLFYIIEMVFQLNSRISLLEMLGYHY